MSQPYYTEVVESETETCDSDDSQEDPSFNILEETRSKLSNLSIKKKSRSRVPVELDDDADFTETSAPVFDANEEKSFETVQKIIEGCQLEKLKVEQCKLYLRKYGLRLTGKKDVLINRIKEHISIKNGEGEHKYPASTFIMNCKGDACTGDVVMFEQNVYEMFNIASRSASGPPCGQRMVAGRIVKESYGAAKQQHTFTIEVLWSKGTKPLTPLHPLLIKGRNLYKLKTMRQRWKDESERQKILSEKHARGNVARTSRDARLQEKKIKKALRENRVLNGNIRNEEHENKRRASSPTRPIVVNSMTSIQHQGPRLMGMDRKQNGAPFNRENMNLNTLRSIDGVLRKSIHVEQKMEFYPLTGMDHNKHYGGPYNKETLTERVDFSFRKSYQVEQNTRFHHPLMGMDHKHHEATYNRENMSPNTFNRHYDYYDPPRKSYEPLMGMDYKHHEAPYNRENMSPNSFRGHYDYYDPPRRSFQSHEYDYDPHNRPKSNSFQKATNNRYMERDYYQGRKRQQLCRYYAHGGCHYGTNCKFLH